MYPFYLLRFKTCSQWTTNLEVIKLLIETKKFDLTAKTNNGYNLLHFACENNTNFEVIKFLIETDAFDLTAKNNNGSNALHLACQYNANLEIIKLLIETKEFYLEATTKDGKNALHLICQKNNANLEVIKLLIETNAFDLNDITATTKDGKNALHLVCLYNTNLEVIKFLIETKKFDLTAIDKDDGSNALHFACQYNANLEVIKFLIETKKFDLTASNNNGNNALHIACRNTNLEVIKLLIEQGSDYNILNNRQKTPLGLLKEKDQGKYEKVLEYTEAAEFADSLISTKITNLESRYLDPELCTEIKELIINRIKNKIYNLTGKDNLTNFFKDYIEANEFLAENLKLLKLKDCNNFNDLTPNTHVPTLQMQILKKYNESHGNKIPLTKKQLVELFQNTQFKCLDELSNDIIDVPEEDNVKMAGNNYIDDM